MKTQTGVYWRISIKSDNGFRVVHILADDAQTARTRVALLDGEQVTTVAAA